jgi:hypothetical protein
MLDEWMLRKLIVWVLIFCLHLMILSSSLSLYIFLVDLGWVGFWGVLIWILGILGWILDFGMV